ncbi:MAG: 50S ribosomal protein L9 [Planctomycetales bacterium]|nr:50S ribosomal protein L9 [Planctomycetales bacterium]
MKVLLVEDVEKLGWLGDVVEVKNGYARNYLLPQGLATVPNEANIKSLAAEKQRRAEIRQMEREQKEQLAAQVEGAEVVIAAKANEQGHLFGSVGERDIAENLRQQGFAIQDDMVRMSGGHIKEVGTHDVSLKIASDLRPAVRVIVVSQDQTVDATEEQTGTEG